MLTATTARKNIRPPSGFENYLCRRDAAARLGFASEFKVRQLEKEGRLHPIRGAMGSAWYPPAQVDALRGGAGRTLSPTAPRVRWPDDALIELLREKPRTVVDLVVDAGIWISRAERVYRFWLAHEGQTVAREPRLAHAARPASTSRPTPPVPPSSPPQTPPSPPSHVPLFAAAQDLPSAPQAAGVAEDPAERRSGERLERDALVRQLRDANPKVRGAAFEKLKSRRR